MKKFLIIIFISLSAVSIAQKNLIVEGTAPGLYITHKVVAGESLFSLARKYNQSVQAIATFNNVPADKGLLLGQTIKVPLTAQNISSPGEDVSGETLIPLYHVVGKNETLFRIGTNLNVALPEVKQWNNLSSDNIVAGTPLIVGHLKVANKQTPVAKVNVIAPAESNITTAPVENSTKPKAAEEPKKEEPVAVAAKVDEQRITPATQAAKIEEKKEEPATATTVAEVKQETPVTNKPEEKKDEPVAAKIETSSPPASQNDQPVATKIVQQENVPMKEETKKLDLLAPEPEMSNEGVFSALYSSDVAQKSLANKAGEAATFKTTSGWQDKKYYVLMNDVPPGTILKISSVDNKFVFAKVLGNMPEMKENKGLLLRLSNAAATYLGMVDAKFPVQVTFYQ